jgi:predicted NBD/HSP70 family sugar kinase
MPEDPVLAATKLIEQIKLFLIKNSEAAFDGIGISVSPRRHINLKGMLERALELPVEIENAANACAAGILWFGNPSHFRDLAVVIVSDNIDVSIVAGGRIVRGLGGTAGEFSHFPIEPNGPRCDCGNNGCWQALASQAAALRYYQELNPGSSPALTFPQLLTSAQQGDRLADCALQRMAVQLGRGIRMIVAGLAPEAVIVIGKAASLWRQFHPIIEAEVNTLRFSTLPPVLLAVHDETKAQMQGMIALLFQKNFGLLNAQ